MFADAEQYKGAHQQLSDRREWRTKIDELRLKQPKDRHSNSCLEDGKKLDDRTYAKKLDAVIPKDQSTSKQLGKGRIDPKRTF